MQKILKRNRTSKKISSLRIGAAFLAVTVLILGTFIFSLMSGSVDISVLRDKLRRCVLGVAGDFVLLYPPSRELRVPQKTGQLPRSKNL